MASKFFGAIAGESESKNIGSVRSIVFIVLNDKFSQAPWEPRKSGGSYGAREKEFEYFYKHDAPKRAKLIVRTLK